MNQGKEYSVGLTFLEITSFLSTYEAHLKSLEAAKQRYSDSSGILLFADTVINSIKSISVKLQDVYDSIPVDDRGEVID